MSKDIQAEREKEEEENDMSLKDGDGEYDDSVMDTALAKMSDMELFGNTPAPKQRQGEELSEHKTGSGSGSRAK